MRLHIVVVDDNAADAEILRYALEQTGRPLEIVVLQNGRQVLDYLSSHGNRNGVSRCALVLLDLNIPVMSGFEILERIKSSDEFRNVPVVIMSGSSNGEDIERCYQAGANSYVCKPSQLPEILVMADQLVAYWSDCAKLPSRC